MSPQFAGLCLASGCSEGGAGAHLVRPPRLSRQQRYCERTQPQVASSCEYPTDQAPLVPLL